VIAIAARTPGDGPGRPNMTRPRAANCHKWPNRFAPTGRRNKGARASAQDLADIADRFDLVIANLSAATSSTWPDLRRDG